MMMVWVVDEMRMLLGRYIERTGTNCMWSTSHSTRNRNWYLVLNQG